MLVLSLNNICFYELQRRLELDLPKMCKVITINLKKSVAVFQSYWLGFNQNLKKKQHFFNLHILFNMYQDAVV